MTTYLSLPSNDPSVLAGSTSGNYTVQLGRSLDARFRMTWRNIKAGENDLVLSGKTLYLPLGYYESVPQLCTALNTLFEGKGVVFNPLPLTLQVQITLPAGQTLQGPALRLLGFDSTVGDGVGRSFTSSKIADVTIDRSSLFVYLSIVANSSQGSFSVPLVKEIPLNNAKPGDVIVYRQPLPVETHILNTPIVRSIEVNIKDTHNKTVDFHGSPVSLLIGIKPAT